jgi:hypothetical protein
MYTPSARLVALSAFAALCLGAADVEAATLNTADFVAACVDDPVVTEDPAFEGSKVTPQTFCQCVAGKLDENKRTQADVDMLTKMHNEDITDAEAEAFPKLDDLLIANEGYGDACRQSLGLSIEETDMEEFPMDEEMTDDGMPEDEEGPPGEDDGPPDENAGEQQ